MIIINNHSVVQICDYDKKPAPCEMARGSATSDDEYAYFMPWVLWGSLPVYTEQDVRPPCSYCNSALVIIDGALTAVGGNGWISLY